VRETGLETTVRAVFSSISRLRTLEALNVARAEPHVLHYLLLGFVVVLASSQCPARQLERHHQHSEGCEHEDTVDGLADGLYEGVSTNGPELDHFRLVLRVGGFTGAFHTPVLAKSLIAAPEIVAPSPQVEQGPSER
jgi:hypothetical protein